MKTVSVALCTYNGEKYLSQQIESIINQSYSASEIIICDDCSTDGTIHILEKYKEFWPFIKVYKNEKQLGFKKNFEKAALLCVCDYVVFADQDDVWTTHHIQVLVDSIGNDLLSCGNSLFVDENLKSLDFTMCQIKHIKNIPSKAENFLFPLLYNGNFFQGACMMVKRDFLNIAFPIPDFCKYHDAWLALSASVFESIHFTNEIINYYRQHSSSITTKTKKIYLPNDITSSMHKVGNIKVCDILCDRYNIKSHSVMTILDVYKHYCTLCQKKKFISALRIRFDHYKEIYTTNSYLYFLPRIIHEILTPARMIEY